MWSFVSRCSIFSCCFSGSTQCGYVEMLSVISMLFSELHGQRCGLQQRSQCGDLSGVTQYSHLYIVFCDIHALSVWP